MPRMLLGAIAAAVAMFILGFIFFATPLQFIGFGSVDAAQSANLQAALAQNIAATGTYVVPNPASAEGTVLYGKGPIAMVHYNSMGFAVADMGVLIGGFVHMLVIALLIGFALLGVASRVTDFGSRARLALLFAVAGAAFIHLGEPVWMHVDWAYAIYGFVADGVMLAAAGLIIARWFLPRAENGVAT